MMRNEEIIIYHIIYVDYILMASYSKEEISKLNDNLNE